MQEIEEMKSQSKLGAFSKAVEGAAEAIAADGYEGVKPAFSQFDGHSLWLFHKMAMQMDGRLGPEEPRTKGPMM